MMVPRESSVDHLDVTAGMYEPDQPRSVRLAIMDDTVFEPGAR
jgi:hypothetical protein